MIYPVNQQIESLLESFIDPETGELNPELTDEAMQEAIEKIQMDFDEKIKSLRNAYLATSLEADCVEAEAKALWQNQQAVSKRAKAVRNRAERTKRFISWLLQGETFTKDGCKITYRKGEDTIIEDGFIEWAKANAPGLLNEPTVRKNDLTAALKAGGKIEFARLEPKKSIQVK